MSEPPVPTGIAIAAGSVVLVILAFTASVMPACAGAVRLELVAVS